jgi:hypothetical protein
MILINSTSSDIASQINLNKWIVKIVCDSMNYMMDQHHRIWRAVPGHKHGKLFISGPCKKRSEDLLKLSRHHLRMVVAILTGHAPVRTHLRTMGLFEGEPACRFCGQQAETVWYITCRCEAMTRRCFNVFGDSLVEPKVIQVGTVRDLCLFIGGIRLLNLYWNGILDLHNKPKAAVHPGQYADGP